MKIIIYDTRQDIDVVTLSVVSKMLCLMASSPLLVTVLLASLSSRPSSSANVSPALRWGREWDFWKKEYTSKSVSSANVSPALRWGSEWDFWKIKQASKSVPSVNVSHLYSGEAARLLKNETNITFSLAHLNQSPFIWFNIWNILLENEIYTSESITLYA